jgi:hypothetical protein
MSNWTYIQSTGELFHPDGSLAGTGYSGHGEGRNNHLLQAVRNVGPIPEGLYKIGHSMNHPLLGPVAIPLSPISGNLMFGRSHFYMHGDNATHSASLGCIVQGRPAREEVADDLGGLIEVIATPVRTEQVT